jgi:hypothetical protein
MSEQTKKLNQVVGNVGLFYTCYDLGKRGWNAMPTSRNARGIDIVIYSQKGDLKYTVQIKSLREKNPVPLGKTLDNLFADYLIICTNVMDIPELYVTTPNDIRHKIHKGQREGRISYWLQTKDYREFKNNWEILPNGF